MEGLTPAQLAKKSETFAQGTYTYFLMQGDLASEELTNKVIDSLNYFTGLSKEYIRNTRERIQDGRFFKELLRDQGKTIGRYDSRYTGEDLDDAGEGHSMIQVIPVLADSLTECSTSILRKDLGYKSDIPYEALTNVWPWDFGNAVNSYLDVSETLRGAMTKNPYLHVMVCCGYYDLATPFYNAEYAVSHMGLRKDVRSNIILNYYNGGHMMYVNKDDDAKLKTDAEKFYQGAVNS